MLTLITVPADEPVSITEAKLHLRVDHAIDDTLITNDIVAARGVVENLCHRALITQTWELWLDAWPDKDYLEIPLPPLQAAGLSIKYYDTADVEATMSSSDYFIDTKSSPGRVGLNNGKSWPSVSLRPINGVVVRFVAGYGAAGSSVPQELRQTILLLVGHFYENREATSQNVFVLPIGIERLMNPYRDWSF